MPARAPRGDRAAIALATLAALAAGAALALSFGQSASWDLRNYHLYGPWAWLNGRLDVDVAPAQLQSFLNPTLHLPLWWAQQRLSSTAITAGLGAVPALAAVLLWRIARRLVPAPADARLPLAALAALAGALGAGSIGLLGTTFGDNLVALIGLGAIVLLLGGDGARAAPGPLRALGAGALLGAAAGLKLSFAPFALALLLALPLLAARPSAKPAPVAAAGAGALAAFALTAGPWMLELALRYGNPVYPYFGALFASPWNLDGATRDLRFVPATIGEGLLHALRWNWDWRAASDYRFRDLRVAALQLALLAAPWWLARVDDSGRRRALSWLLAAFVLGYALWLALFGYYRYLLLWEWLAPLVVAAALAALGRRRLAVLALAVLVLTTNPPDDERVAPSSGPLLALDRAAATLAPGTLVVMTGGEPTAYALPALEGLAAAVRIEGSAIGAPRGSSRLERLAAARIGAHAGPFALLHGDRDDARADAALAARGLARVAPGCRALPTSLDRPGEPGLRLCALGRVAAPR